LTLAKSLKRARESKAKVRPLKVVTEDLEAATEAATEVETEVETEVATAEVATEVVTERSIEQQQLPRFQGVESIW